jgi:hypothetical protein
LNKTAERDDGAGVSPRGGEEIAQEELKNGNSYCNTES